LQTLLQSEFLFLLRVVSELKSRSSS